MPKKDRLHIPQRVDEMTARWFTDVLGAGDASRVTAVTTESIGTDIGFIGEVYRCHLSWDGEAEGADARPASVVVKVPTQHDANFALGDGLQLYEREITVYRELRDSLHLPMPGFLYAAMDPDPAPWLERPLMFLFDKLPIRGINWLLALFLKLAGKSKRRYVLVLEDIANARPPTQRLGGSLADAHAALRVLAAFHAKNWMRSDVVESYGRIWPLDRGCRIYQASYVRNRDHFIERFGRLIGAELMARLDEIQERVPAVNHALVDEPWTLLHNDFRLDNVLFRPDGDLVVLDLQGLGYGRAGWDVAYFITTALTADYRGEERELLRTYHDALVGCGVDDYPWDVLLADCAKTKELLAHRIVGAADILDTQVSDHDDPLIDVLQLRVLDWLD